jgi:hypothetical protein
MYLPGHRSGSDRDGKLFHVNFAALLWTRSAVAINGAENGARFLLFVTEIVTRKTKQKRYLISYLA